MNDQVAQRLRDVLEACGHIGAFIAGKTFQDYEKDYGLRLQIERLLEIVGEALNRAHQEEPTLAEGVPALRRIVGMRNHIIHGYDAVDDELVWLTATYHIPRLFETLERWMRQRSTLGDNDDTGLEN
jgi:uncharacterized protein with HEPN domain